MRDMSALLSHSPFPWLYRYLHNLDESEKININVYMIEVQFHFTIYQSFVLHTPIQWIFAILQSYFFTHPFTTLSLCYLFILQTQYLSKTEMYDMSKAQLLAEVDICMGGRVAEEIIFGTNKVTTGISYVLSLQLIPVFLSASEVHVIFFRLKYVVQP